DPFPDWRERAAWKPAATGVRWRTVEKKRLQRREEVARRRLGAVLARSVLAELRAQPGLDFRGARHVDAAEFQPFEFGEETIARQRRQALQKLPYPVDLRH